MYGSWDMKFNRQNFVILVNILLFYPPNNLKSDKIQNLKNPK